MVNIFNVGTSTTAFTAGAITPSTYSKDFSTSLSDTPLRGSLASGAPVYYTPSTSGPESATYVVYDSSTGSPQTLPLNGSVQ